MTFVIGEQTLTLSDATGAGQAISPPSAGRLVPGLGAGVYVPEGASLYTVSTTYRNRELVLPEGVYFFDHLSTVPLDDRLPASVSRPPLV